MINFLNLPSDYAELSLLQRSVNKKIQNVSSSINALEEQSKTESADYMIITDISAAFFHLGILTALSEKISDRIGEYVDSLPDSFIPDITIH